MEVQSFMSLTSLHTQSSEHQCPTQAQGLQTPAGPISSFAFMFALEASALIPKHIPNPQEHRITEELLLQRNFIGV